MSEFNLKQTASEVQVAIDNGLVALTFKPQSLDEAQKMQGRENIEAASKLDVSSIRTGLNEFTKGTNILVPVEFETISGQLIGQDGALLQLDGDYYRVSSLIPVFANETLYITASKEYANGIYAFYRADGSTLEVRWGGTLEEFASFVDEPVTAPADAAFLRIAFTSGKVGAVKRTVQDGGLKLQPWKGRVWTVVGDSLTEKNARTTMNYHDYIAEATGVAVVNLGYSGSGYAQSGAGKAFHLRIDKVDPNSDAVTIFGSFNDYSAGIELGAPTDTGTDTICGCVNTTIDNLISLMPTVSLGIVTPTPWQNGNPADPNNAQTKYADALIEICKNRSIPCLDLYRCSNLRPWSEEGRAACYSKDGGAGCHPDEAGHKLIAPRFKAFLETLML